jgi:ERCC4-related helicase
MTTGWDLSARVSLRNDRVPNDDADRQQRTAAEILRRLREQPGVILADAVGMGKTYVALAVAASVLDATRRRRPVVIMVPPAVVEKWPTEWAVFEERCLGKGHGLRASGPVRRGSDFLKLLDDPPSRRRHLIFLTHGALTTNLNDPFIRFALLRRATQRRSDLRSRRRAIARFAATLLRDPRFDPTTAEALLEAPLNRWLDVWNRHRPQNELADDPIPEAFTRALGNVELMDLRDAILQIPVQRNATFPSRLRTARHQLNLALNGAWSESLGTLNEHLPLLVLDEAHHLKNPNRLNRLFDNEEAERDVEALQGPLGNMFEKMLFLTATPFQLGHRELLSVLDRFHGVRCPSQRAREHFDHDLSDLRTALDCAQGTALRFERAWGRIDAADTNVATAVTSFEVDPNQPDTLRTALAIGAEAQQDLVQAEELLRPWVIRHVRAYKGEHRRYQPGRSILDDGNDGRGLVIGGRSTLPFLLAARAQAFSGLTGNIGDRSTRSYFAYGLASSFEAYADTRRHRLVLEGQEADDPVAEPPSAQLQWYLDRISAALPSDSVDSWAEHPKVAATLRRVHDLWCNGEKVLVYCFYIETGRALRSHLSRVLRNEIISRAAVGLQIDPADDVAVLEELERVAGRLLRADARGYGEFRSRVKALTKNLDVDVQEQVADVVVRFMRTPSFLTRFTTLSRKTSVDEVIEGMDSRDASGTTLADRIRAFADALARKVDVERNEVLSAMGGIQTGGISTTADDFDQSERSRRRDVLLPNVRLANGGVRQETRRRLMLAFNTPFFPEVLVASSVMAEGVDLHRDCRYVIHHDLDWNPSTLEQRTGRIDRIGSKALASGKPVVIYEPYLGGTYDEKIFRVVKDRERWFGIVMGATQGANERATEEEATRVPLPLDLAGKLTTDLSLSRVGSITE